MALSWPEVFGCTKPLELIDTTIDHQLPESLLCDDARRAAVLAEYGLPEDFNIKGILGTARVFSSRKPTLLIRSIGAVALTSQSRKFPGNRRASQEATKKPVKD